MVCFEKLPIRDKTMQLMEIIFSHIQHVTEFRFYRQGHNPFPGHWLSMMPFGKRLGLSSAFLIAI